MLRQTLSDALKTAMRDKEGRTVATLRLIIAALKDKDIAARASDGDDQIDDNEILAMLQSMIKQRQESVKAFEEGGRPELAAQENEEIGIIRGFLPAQLEGEALTAAIDDVIAETGAESLKDMGPVMAALKARFPGQIDFAKASGVVREKLA
ncbi:MAG: GatB/YqeY domain-containing protein [Pseudomonadota bacterium]|nr:GatB/YqeY domain-containing protein [Pseudomonadota bacterium]MEC8028528.1 GatB/YqeY domain-containing protein [Pseudomonadota bacterium]MEC8061208.1 GatB/YqeY domain-containing protein [Pseudomonadota bacterium]MEC8317737.1 GatB/YqeY domain-containing protein [Pseudomonadota bacterium]MEC8563281.1 GatB/YqeY domain-containing protein [Pseudomonadota bacterium]|tara:strand:- start:1026 stop:1481 length:456 start_codon:yes stop_codon:yes gene_type:complete